MKKTILISLTIAVVGSGFYFSQNNRTTYENTDAQELKEIQEQDSGQKKGAINSLDLTAVCGNLILTAGAPEHGSSGPASETIHILDQQNNLVATTKSGSDGKFKVSVSPGIYTISVPRYEYTKKVSISAGKCVETNIIIAFPSTGF